MSAHVEQMKSAQPRAGQISLAHGTMPLPDVIATTNRTPKVMIRGDIRLRVAEAVAAHRPVKGSYRIDLEDMQEPLQVIWMTEGKVVNHTVHHIDIEFDLRGASVGETRTYVVSAHVAESNGRGRIVDSSVFVQILVTRNKLLHMTA